MKVIFKYFCSTCCSKKLKIKLTYRVLLHCLYVITEYEDLDIFIVKMRQLHGYKACGRVRTGLTTPTRASPHLQTSSVSTTYSFNIFVTAGVRHPSIKEGPVYTLHEVSSKAITVVQVIALLVVIFGINTTSDISKLLHVISRAIRQVIFGTILKYHERYLCRISRTNHAIICLYYYPQKVCHFHVQVFQIKLKYHYSKPIKLQKLST